MIVVISDLHLQHTALDSIRRDEAGKVLETRSCTSVEAGALSLLFAEIVANASGVGATEVHLVFAGDIFELHRTPLWLLAGERCGPRCTRGRVAGARSQGASDLVEYRS